MTFLPAYLDTSAILKLVVPERESDALRAQLEGWGDWVSSALAAVECGRALRRVRAPAAIVRRAEGVLGATTLLKIDEPVLRLAERIGSPDLRTLDAIHLASALSLGDDPEAFVTYDARLAKAARALKLRVLQPGA